jgi:hypothetical protein
MPVPTFSGPVSKILFVTILVAASIAGALPGKIGVWGGINNAGLTVESTLSNGNMYPTSKIGLYAGLSYERHLKNNVSLSTGLFYLQGGAKSEDFYLTNEESPDPYGVGRYVLDNRYLELPVLVQVDLSQGRLRPFLLTGASLGFLLSAEGRIEADVKLPDDFSVDMKKDYHALNLAWEVGMGLNFQMTERIGVSLVGRYALGLINQLKDVTEPETTQKSNDFKILAGLVFGL